MRLGLLLGLLLVLSAKSALADPESDKARAKELFGEAQTLVEAGKHAEACPKFEESVKLHAGIGNQYNLADCWEKIGRSASAYAMFVKVVEATRELGQPEREKAAAERAEALLPKLVRLRVEVKAPAENLALTRDGTPVAKEAWGKPVPVDPGKYELRATAPGKQAWSSLVELPAEPGTVLVAVPPLEDEKKQVVVAAPPPPAKAPKKAPPPAPAEESSGFRSAATIGLLGVGVAGVVVASVMGAQYATSNGDAKDVCPASYGCTQEDIALHDELVDDARTARTWMYVGAGAAAVGLTGAAVLYFTAPSSAERPPGASLDARIFVSRDGAVTGALHGRF